MEIIVGLVFIGIIAFIAARKFNGIAIPSEESE